MHHCLQHIKIRTIKKISDLLHVNLKIRYLYLKLKVGVHSVDVLEDVLDNTWDNPLELLVVHHTLMQWVVTCMSCDTCVQPNNSTDILPLCVSFHWRSVRKQRWSHYNLPEHLQDVWEMTSTERVQPHYHPHSLHSSSSQPPLLTLTASTPHPHTLHSSPSQPTLLTLTAYTPHPHTLHSSPSQPPLLTLIPSTPHPPSLHSSPSYPPLLTLAAYTPHPHL